MPQLPAIAEKLCLSVASLVSCWEPCSSLEKKQGQETRLRGLLDPQATETRNRIRNLTRNLQLSFELLETGMHYATTAASDPLQTSGTSCWPCWVPVQLIASINVRKHNCARISRSRAWGNYNGRNSFEMKRSRKRSFCNLVLNRNSASDRATH